MNVDALMMRLLGADIDKRLKKKFGFCLVVFEWGGTGPANYISNSKRSDMIRSMRETADRLEGREDYDTREDN